MGGSAVQDQVAYWSGEPGQRWADNQAHIDAALRDILDKLLAFADVQSGDEVLDIGCGAGATTIACAPRAAPGRVVGVDISEPLLAVARRRVADAGLHNVDLILADAASHDFEPARFGRVISRLGVMFFPDPPAAFANIRRAMRSGARLAFVCFRTFAEVPAFAVSYEAAKPLLPPQAPSDPDAPGPFAFARAERVRSILSQAGFADITIEPAEATLRSGPLEEAVQSALTLGPLARALTGAGEDVRSQVAEAVSKALVPYDGSEGVTLPAGIWLVGARA